MMEDSFSRQMLKPAGTPETPREPCPDRILDDAGGAFVMGAVGGSAFHLLKGIYNSPNGSRFVGGTQAVRMNAHRIGGSFAVWGGLYSTFDCTMMYVRQKEDPWNSIIAGATAGGFLAMRQGLTTVARAAAFGGILLALLEGAGIALNKLMAQVQAQNMHMDEGMPENQNTGSSSSSWLGGVFGKKNEEVKKSSGSKTEVLESFDAPPVPSFEYK
uniref:Mitochondrial import inner membrane translocase subunit TIM17-2 n=1 Tax=Noccaea caerulescens TaxID=107243 RepID=A0A1J3I8I8_NOCCA